MHLSVLWVTCPVSLSFVMAPVKHAVTHGVSWQFWHLIDIEFGLFVSILTLLTGFGYSFRYALIGSLDFECSIVQYTWQSPQPMHASSLIETRFIVFSFFFQHK